MNTQERNATTFRKLFLKNKFSLGIRFTVKTLKIIISRVWRIFQYCLKYASYKEQAGIFKRIYMF